MQPYIPQSNALPGPSPLSRPGGDASLQSLLGFMSQHASSNSQEGHGAEGEPIRPEAVRMLSQTLGGSGQGAGAQQMLANLAGYTPSNPVDQVASMSTIMQLLGSHPYTAEALQRQLVSGAGPFTITASHGDAGGTSAAQADSGSGGGGGGDAEQSGGGNAGMSDEAVQRKRLAATQEKNRRNQRKYRERQKAKISTSEIQIKDLTDRVEALERLNEQLTLRARDLELAASAATSAPAGPVCTSSAGQKDVCQALARFCSQVSKDGVTEEQVRHFTFRDWRKYTQAYQDRLAQLFAGGPEMQDIRARSELASLVSVKHEAERQAWTHAPQSIHKHYALQARLPPPGSAPASPAAAEWHAILAELELSREQEARLLQARAHVLVQVGALAAERRRIGAALQAFPASLLEESQTLEGHVLTAAAAEQLGSNLQREDQLIFTLLHTFWEVATPLQAARADQLSYPHLPNLMAMCSALASSNGGSGDAASPPHAKRPKVDQSAATATEDGDTLAVPNLETLLDEPVFKEGAQGLYGK